MRQSETPARVSQRKQGRKKEIKERGELRGIKLMQTVDQIVFMVPSKGRE